MIKKCDVMTLWNDEKDCCGCFACYSICPKQAISFRQNDEGFLYPYVDSEKCVGCGLCEKTCAFKIDIKKKHNEEKGKIRVFAVKNKQKDIVRNSSSGGLFSAITDFYLEQGNAVCSCIYNSKTHEVEFKLYEDLEHRNQARGSKYIQANPKDIFFQATEWLKTHPDKELLFVGTGCQTAAFGKYVTLKGMRDKVLLVDLICHGAPSPGLWKEFVSYLEKKVKDKSGEAFFKDKRNGWLQPYTYVKLGDCEQSIKPYADWFYEEWSIRKSCYQCPYTKIHRESDITIGDYWGIQEKIPDFFDPLGVSLMLIQNEKGEKLFFDIKDKIDYVESNEESCLQPRLISLANKPINREKFWRDYKSKGIAYCEKKYKERDCNTFVFRLKRKIKKLYERTHLRKP